MCSLRGVRIPAGQHELTFTYVRSDFNKGRTISLAAFGIALLMLVGGVVAGRAGGRGSRRHKKDSLPFFLSVSGHLATPFYRIFRKIRIINVIRSDTGFSLNQDDIWRLQTC